MIKHRWTKLCELSCLRRKVRVNRCFEREYSVRYCRYTEPIAATGGRKLGLLAGIYWSQRGAHVLEIICET